MAKKKAQTPAEELQAITIDGLQVIELQDANDEEICGYVGDVHFYWFKNGKRNSFGDNEKDLIFK